MANILFLAHRIPYPPNKGDKIRSWHFLKHLAEKHDVHLACFIDDPKDEAHVAYLKTVCASVCSHTVLPWWQKIRSLKGLLFGKPLTIEAYPTHKIGRFVREKLKTADAVFVFSSAMGRFLPVHSGIPIIADVVDADSEKWFSYSEKVKWPLSWLYAREGKLLSAYEDQVVLRSYKTLLVSDEEADILKKRQPEEKAKIDGLQNGVDTSIFDASIYKKPVEKNVIIFTGAMNYLPNIEAVEWFHAHVWPLVKSKVQGVRFRIAGGPVPPRVSRLAGDGVEVTGFVDDMAAEIACAHIAVAPLQTARGIQNKVLEGLAMGKPMIATSLANEGISAQKKDGLYVADTAEKFAEKVIELLQEEPGNKRLSSAARAFVMENFSWDKSCVQLDAIISQAIKG